jgi:hypothetical protein
MGAIRGAQAQGQKAGLQQEMLIVDSRWVGAPNGTGSFPPPTGDPTNSYATAKIGNAIGFVTPPQPTLATGLVSGTSYSSLSVTTLAQPLNPGQVIVLVSGGSGGLVQGWTVETVAGSGATSIAVVEQEANADFPVGTIVSGAAATWPGSGIAMWRQAQVLAAALDKGTGYTEISCTGFLPGVSSIAPVGAQVMTIQPGPLPIITQNWTLYTPVDGNTDTTTLEVTSAPTSEDQAPVVAEATFPAGSLVGIWLPI